MGDKIFVSNELAFKVTSILFDLLEFCRNSIC